MARAPEPEVIHLDTHVVCWLYEGRLDLLSKAAIQALERGRLMIAPAIDLELQFLHEIGRISSGPDAVLSALARDIDLEMDKSDFFRVVVTARDLRWTRDPFDRLIAAQAMLTDARLLTKDRMIRKHCAAALW